MEIIIFIVLVIQAVAFAFFTQILATAKGYPSTAYFWIGLFFSFVGLLFVMGLPTVATPKPAGEVATQQKPIIPPPPQRSFRVVTDGQDIGELPVATASKKTRDVLRRLSIGRNKLTRISRRF
jgi:hypothetical protein